MLAGPKVRRRIGLVLVVSVVASLLAFCPAAFASLSTYVTNEGSNTVSQYTVAADGTLSPKSPATVAAGSGPIAVALSPDGTSAYVANAEGGVSQYTVAANGTLSPKTPATVATGTQSPWAIALSADGKSAYVDHYASNRVSSTRSRRTGRCRPKTASGAGGEPRHDRVER